MTSGHFLEDLLNLPTPTPRPLKNASDGALMDDNQNEWGDEELETKKFRVSPLGSQASLGGTSHFSPKGRRSAYSAQTQFEEPVVLPDLDDQTDHRQWTQQHLDAADLRVSAMAPTPPQGEVDADCMDVNVRGPGKATGDPCTQP